MTIRPICRSHNWVFTPARTGLDDSNPFPIKKIRRAIELRRGGIFFVLQSRTKLNVVVELLVGPRDSFPISMGYSSQVLEIDFFAELDESFVMRKIMGGLVTAMGIVCMTTAILFTAALPVIIVGLLLFFWPRQDKPKHP